MGYLCTHITRGLAMAGNVTGNIGGSNVLLENAATEATLQMLLQATLATTKEQKKTIGELVQKAGMDPAKVKEAEAGLSKLGQAATSAGGALAGLNTAANGLNKAFTSTIDAAAKLTDNQGKASDMFGVFAGMGGVVGLVAGGFQRLAQFQEKQLSTYQSLTQNGINFGGSLTYMRLSASNMYLTMDQFSAVMTKHSGTFARLGGTAEQGAQTFTKMSSDLLKGPMGKNLMNLGYTAEQVNDGLAGYLQQTGARGKMDEKTTREVTAAAADYMDQLNGLAELSGKSRKELEEEVKTKAANVAFQSAMSKMSVEEQKKASEGLALAMATGGQGMADAYMAQVMGVAVTTKAGQQYTALYSEAAEGARKSADMVRDSSKTRQDMEVQNLANRKAQAKADSEISDEVKYAITSTGGKLADTMTAVGTLSQQQSKISDEDYYNALKKKELTDTEAANAVKNQREMMEAGQALLRNAMPIIKALTSAMNFLVSGFSKLVEYLDKSPIALGGLIAAVSALTLLYTGVKVKQGYGAAKELFGGGSGGGGSGGGGAGKAIGGAADGLGKVGPMLNSLGKGAGSMFKGLMTGIAGGLKAFANPQVLIGAVGFGAAIAVIGAGIAAAAWIMGKALPTLAEGLLKFNDLDGKNLGEVGIGMIQMGAGLAVFGAGGAVASVGTVVGGLADSFGSFFGVKSPIDKMKEFAALGPELGVAGKGMASFNTSLVSLLTTDQDKLKNLVGNLKNLTTTLKELKEASKPVEKGLLDSATEMLKAKLTPEVTKEPLAAGGSTAKSDISPVIPKSNDPTEILRAEMQTLNKVSMELLRAMRENVEFARSSANSLARNGNLFRRA